jgi:hypothetical protein
VRAELERLGELGEQRQVSPPETRPRRAPTNRAGKA